MAADAPTCNTSGFVRHCLGPSGVPKVLWLSSAAGPVDRRSVWTIKYDADEVGTFKSFYLMASTNKRRQRERRGKRSKISSHITEVLDIDYHSSHTLSSRQTLHMQD